MILFGLAMLAFIFPEGSDFIFVIAGLLFLFGRRQQETAPLKMPIQSRFLDNNRILQLVRLRQQRVFSFGNEMKSGKEVWLTNSDQAAHVMCGYNSAGKTETLIGFARMRYLGIWFPLLRW